MILPLVAIALTIWWLTGSAWPILPVWLGLWLLIRTWIWGEVITDWHQPVVAALLAAIVVALPRMAWNTRRNYQQRPLGVSFRRG